MDHPAAPRSNSQLSAFELAKREGGLDMNAHLLDMEHTKEEDDRAWWSLFSSLAAQTEPSTQTPSTTFFPAPPPHQLHQPALPSHLHDLFRSSLPSGHSNLQSHHLRDQDPSPPSLDETPKSFSSGLEHLMHCFTSNAAPPSSQHASPYPLFNSSNPNRPGPSTPSVLPSPPSLIPSASASSFAFPPPEPFIPTSDTNGTLKDQRYSYPLLPPRQSSFPDFLHTNKPLLPPLAYAQGRSPSITTDSLPSFQPASDSPNDAALPATSSPKSRKPSRSASASNSKPSSPSISPKATRPKAGRRVSSAKGNSKTWEEEEEDPKMQSVAYEDEDDKRRRNTEASARFRAKKKAKVQDLSTNVTTLEKQARDLELEAGELRRENGWLKEIVFLKRNVAAGDALNHHKFTV